MVCQDRSSSLSSRADCKASTAFFPALLAVWMASSNESQPAVPTLAKHSFSLKRPAVVDGPAAVVDVSEVPLPCRPPATKISRKDGGGIVNVLSLPDVVVEQLFDLLDDTAGLQDEVRRSTASSRARKFPANRNVLNLAFSCSQFAKVFRQSYVRDIFISDMLLTPEDALVYHEAVRGALWRFTSAEKLIFSGINCVSVKLFEVCSYMQCLFDKLQNGEYLTNDEYEEVEAGDAAHFLQSCRSAVAARQSIESAVVCGSESEFRTNITEIVFHWDVECNRFCQTADGYWDLDAVREVWKWETEKDYSLVGYLPNLKAATFYDLPAFYRASELCGPSGVGLKSLTLSYICQDCTEHTKHSVDYSLLTREVAKFHNIEILVLEGLTQSCTVEFTVLENAMPGMVGAMVEALPKLKNLTISFGRMWSDSENVQAFVPVLALIFRKLASCVRRLVVLTFMARVNDDDTDMHITGLDQFRDAILREFHVQQFRIQDNIIGAPDDECNRDITVVVTSK